MTHEHAMTRSQELRLLLSVGILQARGFVTRAAPKDRVAVRVDGRGYRYLAAFWERTGVLDATGSMWLLRVEDDSDAARVRGRIAMEWITAGAPAAWARGEAERAVVQLLRFRRGTAPYANLAAPRDGAGEAMAAEDATT